MFYILLDYKTAYIKHKKLIYSMTSCKIKVTWKNVASL